MGRVATRRSSPDVNSICSAFAISRDTRSWISNTSSSVPLYFSAHRCVSSVASMSCEVILTLFPAFLTVPSNT